MKKKGDAAVLQAFRDRVRARIGTAEGPSNGSWYEIRNKDEDVAEIRIYEEIHWFWGIGAEDFARELDEITAPEILVMINSPGGDVFDGVAIYNALRAHPAKITTRVDGIAASVASVIAQAGDHRIMLTGSQMMIHEAWGLAIGTADEMRSMAELLDRQNDNIAAIYGRRAEKTQGHFRDLMVDDKWFNADETVAEGLADEVVDLPPKADAPKDGATNKTKTLQHQLEEASEVASSAIQRAEAQGTDSSAELRKTVQNELEKAMAVASSAIQSAERVAAHRAEQGRELSQVNRDSLEGLKQSMERLRALREDAGQEQESDDEDIDDIAGAIDSEFLRYVETNVGI